MQFRARRCAVILEYGPLWKVVRMPYTPYFTLLALRPHPIFQYVGWKELRTQLLMPWRNKVRTPKSLKNCWAPARVASQRSPMFGQPWQSRCRGYFVDSTSFHWSNLAGLGCFAFLGTAGNNSAELQGLSLLLSAACIFIKCVQDRTAFSGMQHCIYNRFLCLFSSFPCFTRAPTCSDCVVPFVVITGLLDFSLAAP